MCRFGEFGCEGRLFTGLLTSARIWICRVESKYPCGSLWVLNRVRVLEPRSTPRKSSLTSSPFCHTGKTRAIHRQQRHGHQDPHGRTLPGPAHPLPTSRRHARLRSRVDFSRGTAVRGVGGDVSEDAGVE